MFSTKYFRARVPRSVCGPDPKLEAWSDDRVITSLTDKSMYVKVFGERHTGTNYLSRIIRKNFIVEELRGTSGMTWHFSAKLASLVPAEKRAALRQAVHDINADRTLISDFGWKHSAPNMRVILQSPISAITLFVIVTKHPYFWIRSLHKRPYNFRSPKKDLSEFIRAPWSLYLSDGLARKQCSSPVEMLRLKMQKYKELMAGELRVLHFRYEDFLNDFDSTAARLKPYLMLQGEKIDNFETSTKEQGKMSFDDYRLKYRLDRANEALDQKDRAYIQEMLGSENFRAFGYTP